ncbi:hypothetical protein QBC34DRAFT_443079 [Podospora aff. communis PSN243]|uniref:Nephrocystin 3-like N-terminal domain-containing protein n=1 Tax=Podospora aff. communis PSN243 TaxID=3040156 RepID=A0AAV9G8W0_9PEZI|nr:hypothetical protein QBC34DRAFT_443079 [Podospora aff. communis PSN243]
MEALSIAAAAIQFLDFGSRLLGNALSSYKSPTGQTKECIELSAVSNDLNVLATQIQDLCAKTTVSPGHQLDSVKLLRRLSRECKLAGDELRELVAALQSSGVTRLDLAKSSFIAALKATRSGDRIQSLQSRMQKLRTDITAAVLVCLWEESQKQGTAIDQILETQQDLLRAQVPTLDSDDAKMIKEELEFLGSGTDDNRNSRQAMPGNGTFPGPSAAGDLDQAILESLNYQAISHREEAIPKAHKSTFEWIFSSNPRGHWDAFPEWLTGNKRENYWITGKPGSGKSTLMKFLAGSDRFKRLVAAWSGDTPYVIATFFSWQAGVEIQRSTAGLVRSMLYQCISAKPGLARYCSKRWSFYEIFGCDVELPEWTEAELRVSLDALLSARAGQSDPSSIDQKLNIVLLVDGFDEFSESTWICSRPWNVFLDAYARTPSLKLENLTRNDIVQFVRSNFESHSGFLDLSAVSPAEAEQLTKSVVDKAAGVFLWVSIVVQLLLAGLTEGDSISDLQAVLDQLQGDLENLYEGIWSSVDEKYRVQGVQFFLMFNVIKEKMALAGPLLWLADDPAPHNHSLRAMDVKKINTVMKRRLTSRTKGLLELSIRGTVQYIHRTAHDWVISMVSKVVDSQPPNFNPSLELLKAFSCAASIHPHDDPNRRIVPLDSLVVGVCLYLAGEAPDTEESIGRLTTYLDFLEDQMPLPYLTMNQCNHRNGRNSVGFSALAASYELWGYLRERVTRDPTSALAARGDFIVLEATIFPNICIEGINTRASVYPIAEQEIRCRLDMLKFLIDAGAEPVRRCHSADILWHKVQNVYGPDNPYAKAVLAVLSGKVPCLKWLEREGAAAVQPRASNAEEDTGNESHWQNHLTLVPQYVPQHSQRQVKKQSLRFRLRRWAQWRFKFV